MKITIFLALGTNTRFIDVKFRKWKILSARNLNILIELTKLVAGKDYTCAVCRNEKLRMCNIVHFTEELCIS